MNKEVTFRQIGFMYIFITISPILRQIPNAVASEAGKNGYFSTLLSLLVIMPLTGIIIALLKVFPGFNLYEIMVHTLGKFVAKCIIFIYFLWILFTLVTKVSIYSSSLQATLMPYTKTNFFLVSMILLVCYALQKGMKTVFRISEFTLVPILLLLAVLIICAIPRIRIDYLQPVSTINVRPTINAAKNVVAIGGYIILTLFFSDKFRLNLTKQHINKLWFSIGGFTAIAFLITATTIGINGAKLTARLPYPFFVAVKNISILNAFERFEAFITLICLLSDFVMICIFAIILIRCLQWIFDLDHMGFLYVPIIMLVYYLTFYLSSTQFELEYLYKNIMVNANIVFQYVIPLVLALVCLMKKKRVQKQY